MSSVDKEKIDELLGKIKTLGNRAKEARSSFGSPLVDRALERLTKISAKLPSNGDSRLQSRPQQPSQPEEPRISCPKCGKTFFEDPSFCSGCGFPFLEERRRRQREDDERERLQRFSKMGVKF
jgi:ribosomal protein L37E